MINGLTQYEYLSLQQEEKNFWLSIILGVVTFISVIIIYIDYRNRKNKEQAEKSIIIAEQFAKEIIIPLAVIYRGFEEFGIDKLVRKRKFIFFTDFDIDEAKSLYSDEDLKEYEKLFEKCNEKYQVKNVGFMILNNLEHMCMNIATKVADEKYIYNSLHQQFFKAINLLYLQISLINTDNKDKYYTNIICVFNIWKDKYIKAEKKEKKLKNKTKPKISKIN